MIPVHVHSVMVSGGTGLHSMRKQSRHVHTEQRGPPGDRVLWTAGENLSCLSASLDNLLTSQNRYT